MKKLFNKIAITVVTIIIAVGYSNISVAHEHTEKRQLINKLKKEITELGCDPVKKKGLLSKIDYWIIDLKKQLEECKKDSEEEKAKKVAIESVKKEILKELEKLGVKPKEDTKDIDTNEEIIELRKLLEDTKKKAEEKEKAEKKKAALEALKKEIEKEIESLGGKPITNTSDLDSDGEIIALRKQLEELKKQAEEKRKAEEKKKAEEKAKEEKKQARDNAVQNVKKEILFLGETPIPEYEFTSEDKYIEALRKQIEEIKKLKEEEELKINAEIPDWYQNFPQGSETIMYARGSAISADLDNSELVAIENAILKLASQLKNRINQKMDKVIKEAGVDGDLTLKTEIQRISTIVVKEVSIGGYKVYKTKMAPLANGKYRTFILIEFPISLAYKQQLKTLEQSTSVSADMEKIKNTDAFKELEQFVSEFTGA